MPKNLVIVESPAKAKTISKYLGKDFEVMASYGHVRDLVPKEGAVDPNNKFAMKYQIIERSEKHVNAIVRALKKASALYLATDPDREGEAISWHLIELLKEKDALNGKSVHRVVFYEITKNAVQEAVEHPRDISGDLVGAQQARRALDYLFGFNLSPLLWRKVGPKLSAGRVQSPALRMIVERELQIEAFKAREYWSIEADLSKNKQPFASRLVTYKGDKVEQFSFENEAAARAVEQTLLEAAEGKLKTLSVTKKQRRRNPAAPFTTSTLQQEASRKLGFNTQRTMRTAQRLYEGIELPGEGNVGLITYMRTDSVTLAEIAVDEIRDVIAERYGKENVPEEPRQFKTKAKNAQEAHEAVRPTSVARHPDDLKGALEDDQFRLYSLIWKRTMACQMVPAVFDTVAIDFAAGPEDAGHVFRANGSVLVEPGFIAVYQEGKDDAKDDEGDRLLPEIEEGDVVDLDELRPEQHFTEPPPRYTEASLVKALEEYGIGRPSTYASIIATLKNREYVEMDGKRFLPTDIGRIVNGFLTDHFTQYVDYDFTARLEDDLDAVSLGEKDWVPLLDNFWRPFHELCQEKESSVTREQVAQARELGTDPKTGKPVTVRMGRYGPFVQIGTKDDEEKPKFAGLRPGQKMNDITFEEAMELFKLPRQLGETADGLPVSASVGRFGPYVRYGDKYVSIRGEDDPYTIELPRALELIELKKIEDANRIIQDFEEEGIQVLNGRYGPYITNKKKNARVPKDREPKSLTLEECQELLAAAPERGRRGKKKAKKKASSEAAPKKAAAKKKPAKKKTKKKAAKKAAKKKPD
ncbi:MAG: DNA topoisomerase I [Gammaproteobacteria bacterium]|jgi:DNA topoisomerase-1|nr:DNA topoisomerase I [Gammaproteobacteria bacterium]MDH3863762.1 DNA topoisomerase I [Gammaproteobacteria bacterium]MDH3904554.1 DNA topoisomerase I [Gammaproteobacteria bacterium]MDH3952589.1 DNA topoisomerase I [Gammaproteobacteria bacterium]MDH4003747.1 DNA topoisomerase I [Gammaproteobacteria bacterium]